MEHTFLCYQHEVSTWEEHETVTWDGTVNQASRWEAVKWEENEAIVIQFFHFQ